MSYSGEQQCTLLTLQQFNSTFTIQFFKKEKKNADKFYISRRLKKIARIYLCFIWNFCVPLSKNPEYAPYLNPLPFSYIYIYNYDTYAIIYYNVCKITYQLSYIYMYIYIYIYMMYIFFSLMNMTAQHET